MGESGMVYDDHFGEGMGYLLLFIGFFLMVFGSLEIAAIYYFLKRTKNRILRFGIPVLVLLPGYFLVMGMDASTMIFLSIFFVGPMAALIPPLAVNDLTDPKSTLDRILICYIVIAVFEAVLLFAFSWSGLEMVHEVYWHTPLSNAVVFAGVLILDILVAFFLYGIMKAYRASHPVKEERLT
jgi:hypothetical protein